MGSTRRISVALIIIIKLDKLACNLGSSHFLTLSGIIGKKIERFKSGQLNGIVNIAFCTATVVYCCVRFLVISIR